ncbi:hypothetical protein, partial [Alistipes ihumii]|uniref:hypothetical protein n=1 Tax=Alistipes ihumii TaxID=1470347 RepID=UPI003A873BAC
KKVKSIHFGSTFRFPAGGFPVSTYVRASRPRLFSGPQNPYQTRQGKFPGHNTNSERAARIVYHLVFLPFSAPALRDRKLLPVL